MNLAAVAVSTVAIAGAAQAQQYNLSQGTVAGATVKAQVTYASEAKIGVAAADGKLGLIVTPSVGAILPVGNSKLTFALTGGHTFGNAVTPGAIVANGGCTPTTVISAGGLAGDNQVTFLISNLAGCNNATPIHVALPVRLANTTTNVGVNSTFVTELNSSIDGGSKNLADTIKFGKAFSVTFTPDPTASAATLGNFKALTDGALGTIKIDTAAGVVKSIADTSVVAAQADVTSAKYTFTGSATTVDLTFDGTKLTAPALTYTKASPDNTARALSAAPLAAPVAIVPSTYAGTVELTLSADYTAQAAFGPTALQPITRQGTTYLIPWVASNTLVNTNNNDTIVRIANIGSTDTGQVSVELLSSSTGQAVSTALVPYATKITKGGELVINSNDLQVAFGGGNFGRGDIRITVEASGENLIARRFMSNRTNGVVSEVSLGRTAAGGGSEPIN
jgi:hypothetical protein